MDHLNLIESNFPSCIWSSAEYHHNENMKGGYQAWPDYCYLPMAVWSDICIQSDIETYSLSNITAIISGLGAWRNDRIVYRIPEYVFDMASKTKLPKQLPVDKIIEFSKKGMYFELPGGDFIQGCFIHIEYDFERNEPELRLLLDARDSLLPAILHLGDWSLKSGIERSLPQYIHETFKKELIDISYDLLKIVILTMLLVMEGEFDVVVSHEMPNARGSLAKLKKIGKKGGSIKKVKICSVIPRMNNVA
nr:hypothetical protein [uncultured Tolumonas sp.]